MQSKQFQESVRQTIPQVSGVNTLVIENTENHRVNYHGIRFSGRINSEVTVGANFGSGYITLMCIPVDGVSFKRYL